MQDVAAAPPEPDDLNPEWRPYLDEELRRLPEKYRVPVVLCELEGRPRKEAARLLQVPEGTLSSRLATARKLLGRRLAARRGVPLSAGFLAACLPGEVSAVPPSLAAATVRTAANWIAGPPFGLISGKIVALTEGVIRTMRLTSLKIAALLAVALGTTTVGVGLPFYPALTPEVAEAVNDVPPTVAVQSADDDEEDQPGVRRVKVGHFHSLSVNGAFKAVEIVRADKFSLTITAEEGPLDFVRVRQHDETLTIDSNSTDPRTRQVLPTLKARVTLPALQKLTVTGASRAVVRNFRDDKTFEARLSGVSTLEGTIRARHVLLSLTGASSATLEGSAKSAKVTATGACRLSLADLVLDRADVTLVGGSRADVHVKSALDYALSGACKLKYRGNPQVGKAKTNGASSAIRQ